MGSASDKTAPTQRRALEVGEQTTELVDRVGSVWIQAARAWTGSTSRMMPQFVSAVGTTVFNPRETAEWAFDFAEQLLVIQRQFTQEFFRAVQPVADNALQQQREVSQALHQQEQRWQERQQQQAQELQLEQEREQRRQQRQQRQERKEHFEAMTVDQLQEEAGKTEVEGRSSMNKQDLVKALTDN